MQSNISEENINRIHEARYKEALKTMYQREVFIEDDAFIREYCKRIKKNKEIESEK